MKLIINNLKKSFKKNEVLTDISYEFQKGNIYSIIGRNGAGKTTLFRCVNGDLELDGGNMYIVDDDGKMREITFDDVGLVSASPVLPEFLTGKEFLEYFIKLNKNVKNRENYSVSDYFDLMNIKENDRHKLIKYYSYGMQNKLQLLCNLIRDPLILLLDEPLSSFDILVSHDIKSRLIDIKKDHIIIMSTHILQLATDISDRILLLKNGTLKDSMAIDLKDASFENYIMRELEE